MVARHGRRSRVETVDGTDLGVMMMVGRGRHHRAQRVHPGETFAAQGRRHLGRPVVVRAVRAVERVRVGKRLTDETVQTGAEAGLEVHRVGRGVRVARLLPPLRPPVFEPYLRTERQLFNSPRRQASYVTLPAEMKGLNKVVMRTQQDLLSV